MSSSRSGTLFLAVLSLLLLPIHAGRADSFIGYAEKEGEGVAAGATGGAAGRRVVLHTTWGPIPIELLEENAPKATQLVWDLAQRRGCERCRFYRNEARPPPDSAGPPYALLQGSIEQLDDSPTFEGLLKLPVKAGNIAFIPNTKDFFIALGDHMEWGTAHTVWGRIGPGTFGWVAVELITAQNHTEFTHPEFGTVMRMLLREAPFTIAPNDSKDSLIFS